MTKFCHGRTESPIGKVRVQQPEFGLKSLKRRGNAPRSSLKRTTTTTTEATSAESSSTTKATTTKARSGAAGTWRRNECLVRVRGHRVHRGREEDGIEAYVRCGPDIPGRRILHDALKGFGPAVLDPQSHGIGQDLFES